MKKKKIALLLVLAFALQACAVVRFTEDGQEIKEQTRILYVVGGIAPLMNNKVKVGPSYVTKQDALDWLISALTSGIIYSHSVFPQ